MYSYIWDSETRGYLLTSETGKFIANEIRPVFAEELYLTGLSERLVFDKEDISPIAWAIRNSYYYNGEMIAQCDKTKFGQPISPKFFFEGNMALLPVDVEKMIQKNAPYLEKFVRDAKIRVKELYDKDIKRCDIAYIAFSGGKDSVALLDICDKVLPNNVPVIFSDTTMELPDSYIVWYGVQKAYPDREFISVRANTNALDNWRFFGPPSRTIRWCCSVHKSAPAILYLRERVLKKRDRVKQVSNNESILCMAFTGVRQEESNIRANYSDSSDGIKAASQINRMPLLEWGAHEIWLYIFSKKLIINNAYRKGLSRVGCIMCPESSEKYVWYVDKAYPKLIDPYLETIIETSSKSFSTKEDEIDFVSGLGWQARKSGITLKNNITRPNEKIDKLKVEFSSNFISKELFFEWIKPLGSVEREKSDNDIAYYMLYLPSSLFNFTSFTVSDSSSLTSIEFEFRNEKQKREMLPLLRVLLNKASACIGCEACCVECVYGAISSKNGRITIDQSLCKRCLKCYKISNGCWRYKSMYKSEVERANIRGINRYNNFGLREKERDNWVSTLVELGNQYFPWHDKHPQGKKMVESASAWFQQAGLVEEKTRIISPLVDLFKQKGSLDRLAWDIIWLNLANNSPLVKWVILNTPNGARTEIEVLYNMLSDSYPSLNKSTIDGGFSAFKDMISKSPIGGDEAIISYEMKGRSVVSITRNSVGVDSLVVLYGLYLLAQLSNRSTFTLRELMVSDTSSINVSPLVAFGIKFDDFKHQCQGLQTKYPDYILCTFTHGLDGITVYPQKHSIKEIIEIAKGEK